MVKRKNRNKKKARGSLLFRLLALTAAAFGLGLFLRRSRPALPPGNPRALPGDDGLPAPGEHQDPAADSGVADLPEDVETSWIPGPGGSLRVAERHRQGAQTLVFVHGLGGRLEHWAAALNSLGPMHRGVAFDLSGHGESDPSDQGYSVATLAADLAAVVDGLRLRRVVLVGHSLGALAAIEYAATHRDRVSGLFLVDPSGDQTRLPSEEVQAFLQALEQDPRGETRWYFEQLLNGSTAEVAERVLEDLESTSEAVLYDAVAEAATYSPLPALERYGGPVGCAVSELNSLPNSLPSLLPELPVDRLTGTGHWLMLDRPATLQTILDRFLEGLRNRLRPATVH